MRDEFTEWQDYAKRGQLLKEDGTSSGQPHETALTISWNAWEARSKLHDAVAWAKRGIRSTWGDFEAEGIVARPNTELNTRSGQRVVAKIKCRDFAA